MNERLKVLFVEYCEDYTAGGAQRVFADIITHISRGKIDVYAALPNPTTGDIAVSLPNYVKKYHYNPRAPRGRHKRLLSYLTYAFYVPFTVLLYSWRVWRQKIDVIYTHSVISGLHFGLVSLFSGRPIIYHEHNMADQRPKQLVWQIAFSLLCRKALCVIAISEHVKKSLSEHGVPNEKITVVHNGISFTNYNQHNIEHLNKIGRARLGVPSDCLLVGMVGHFRRWKGQHILLQSLGNVLQKNNSVMYVFVGGVHDESYFQENVHYVDEHQLSAHVIFAGYQEKPEELIASFDVFALTANPEPFGLVLLEAMSLYKPTIAFNTGGPAEIIEDGISGILIPPDDVGLLEESINDLLNNAKRREEIGRAGCARVQQKFSLASQVEQIEEVLFSCSRKANQ